MTDALVDFLSCNFNGVSIAVLLALIIGVVVACYEGIKYKFDQYVKTGGDPNAVFDKKYLISGVIAIIACFATVWIVFAYQSPVTNGVADGLLGQVETMIVTFVAVLTEALVLIKACNRRLDTMFLDDDVIDGGDEAVAKEQTGSKISELKLKL